MSKISSLVPIAAGVPQGAISSLIQFNLYSGQMLHTSTADFANDKIIYSSYCVNQTTVGYNLQNHLEVRTHLSW